MVLLALAATICSGEFAVLTTVVASALWLVFCAIVLPILGGLLHVPWLAAETNPGLYLSVVATASFAPVVLVFAHVVSGGTANTIQFHPISLNGLGNALPTV